MAAVAAVAFFVAGLGFATAFPPVFSIAVDHRPPRAGQLSGPMVSAIVGGSSSRRLGSGGARRPTLVAQGGRWYMFCNAQSSTSIASLGVAPSAERNFTLMRAMLSVAYICPRTSIGDSVSRSCRFASGPVPTRGEFNERPSNCES